MQIARIKYSLFYTTIRTEIANLYVKVVNDATNISTKNVPS